MLFQNELAFQFENKRIDTFNLIRIRGSHCIELFLMIGSIKRFEFLNDKSYSGCEFGF